MENFGKLKPSSKPDGCGKQKVQDIRATSNDTSFNVLEKSRSKFTILEDLYEESKILENIEFLKKKKIRELLRPMIKGERHVNNPKDNKIEETKD